MPSKQAPAETTTWRIASYPYPVQTRCAYQYTWNRFSWFGFHSVLNDGKLELLKNHENLSIQELGDAFEAILIESMEPRQNRKQGNTFFGIEYLQQESPEIKKKQKEELVKELLDKL